MILIDASKLNSIRAQFIRNKNIINKDKFVEILLFNLPESLKADKKFNRTNVVKEILKLFKQVNFYLFYYQIDVTGEGIIHWENFSAYCIEAGMAAVLKLKLLPDYIYKPLNDIEVHTKGTHISCCEYIPELDRIFVGEYGSLIPKTYLQYGEYVFILLNI